MAKTPRTDSTPLPTGTVTFLFTDIEGSTGLWEAHHEAMRQAVARHDALMRQAIAARGGYVFKTVGDAFCASFATAPQAVLAVLSAQQALHAEPWPEGLPIRVRMALHTGAAEVRDADYFGTPLNHVARLLAIAHGGQTLVSEITHDLCRDRLPIGSTLKPLGEHGLKDHARRGRVPAVPFRVAVVISTAADGGDAFGRRGDAIDRRTPVREYEPGRGERVFRRWPCRGAP
jgi:class 3 adenylate cyclase